MDAGPSVHASFSVLRPVTVDGHGGYLGSVDPYGLIARHARTLERNQQRLAWIDRDVGCDAVAFLILAGSDVLGAADGEKSREMIAEPGDVAKVIGTRGRLANQGRSTAALQSEGELLGRRGGAVGHEQHDLGIA